VLRSITQACPIHRRVLVSAEIGMNLVVGIGWDSFFVGKAADPLARLLGDTNFLDHLERPYCIDNTPGTI
jgi:hypothetical protein